MRDTSQFFKITMDKNMIQLWSTMSDSVMILTSFSIFQYFFLYSGS